MTMDEQLKIEEYKSLRGEMGQRARYETQILYWSIATTGVILGFGVKEKSALMCVAPFLVLAASLLVLLAQWNGMVRIASFLRVGFEKPACARTGDPQKSIVWERLWIERCSPGQAKDRLLRYSPLGIFIALGLFCAMAAVATAVAAGESLALPLIFALAGLSVLGFLASSAMKVWALENRRAEDSAWREAIEKVGEKHGR